LPATLANTIWEIRKRLRLNQEEFARLLEVKQNTVSQYESGRVAPSKVVLSQLLQKAEGNERDVILDALGVRPAYRSGWSPGELEATIAAFSRLAEFARPTSGPNDGGREEIAEIVCVILEKDEAPPPWLLQTLRLWRDFGGREGVVEFFDQLPAYLTIRIGTEAPTRRMASLWQVWIKCPQTGKGVRTGSTVDDQAGLAAMAKAGKGGEVYCRHCRSNHKWKASNAYLRRAP